MSRHRTRRYRPGSLPAAAWFLAIGAAFFWTGVLNPFHVLAPLLLGLAAGLGGAALALTIPLRTHPEDLA